MKRLFPLLVLIILFALGCEREKKEETQKPAATKETNFTKEPTQTPAEKGIVARVNGKPIYEEGWGGRPLESAINDEILYEGGLKRGLDKKLKTQVEAFKKRLTVNALWAEIKDLPEKEKRELTGKSDDILYKEGVKRGLDKKFETQVELYKKGLIVANLKAEIISNLPPKGKEQVSEKEIGDYYKANEIVYTYLHVKGVSTDDKNIAEEIHKRAVGGESLEKISSDYPGKDVTVTDWGFTKKYNDIFNGKGIDSISDVIREGGKFEVLKLIDSRKIPLSKVKGSIRYIILAKRRGDAIQKAARQIEKENNIKVEIIGEQEK
jgi:hypothetical protein